MKSFYLNKLSTVTMLSLKRLKSLFNNKRIELISLIKDFLSMKFALVDSILQKNWKSLAMIILFQQESSS